MAIILTFVLFFDCIYIVNNGRIDLLVGLIVGIVISYIGIKTCMIGNNHAYDMKNYLFEHWMLGGLICILLILSYEKGGMQIKWDSGLYYRACDEMSLYSMSSLGAYGHLSHAYGTAICILNTVFHNTMLAMTLLNLSLMIIGVYYFYKFIVYIVPHRSIIFYTLCTALYAFSPYVLGMVNYFSLDYAMTLLFCPLLYYLYKQEWVHFFVVSFLFCFTKEPAVVVYVTLCIGWGIRDLLYEKDRIEERIKRIFLKKEYYLMIVVALFWLVTYVLLGGWNSKEGEFGRFVINAEYIYEKIISLLVFNYMWLLLIFVVAGFFTLKKKHIDLIPIYSAIVGFCVISFVFNTVNHARYADIIPTAMSIIAVTVIGQVNKNWFVYSLTCIVSFIMLCSCYVTIDPVSYVLFDKIDTGSGYILTTGQVAPGDAVVYNKQALWLENALNEAIEYGINNDATILIPMYEESVYNYNGLPVEKEAVKEGFVTREYWNARKKQRKAFAIDNEEIIDILNVNNSLNLEIDGTICYLNVPTASTTILDGLKDNYILRDIKKCSYRGWIVEAYLFENK